MAIRGAFIGIDRYQDAAIRELTGAKRDATALWALFTDSIPDMQSTLLTNEGATKDAISGALEATLGAANSDDTVIVSFAGHGSKSHRLLAYDTSGRDVVKSTYSMADLADLFRESRARFILCILDCCFSGGAAARVFEDDTPTPRDEQAPLTALVQGKGRILIAAANTNEPAYEQPNSRHGLFTKALLEVLQGFSQSVDLPTAMSQVMERVRAEAARMGYTQTPMLFGRVEGGMLLPPLRAGNRYHTEFPEVMGARVTGKVQDLSVFGFPALVLDAWSGRFRGNLNELQIEAINEYRILDGESLLVVAPTSSGKTFIGEMAAVRAVLDGRKAVFLLPYKALASEKYEQFESIYGQQLGMRVIRCTSDYTDQREQFMRGKYDLALLTFEMFLTLAVRNSFTLTQIGVVVLDEAQFISEPKRGITVELLLTYLIAARERGIEPQIIALSAVIGSVNHFDEWLGCTTLVTHKRPVRLVEGVLDHDGRFQYRDVQGEVQTKQLVPRHLIVQRRRDASAQDVIVPLVRQLMANPREKVIIFRNMRDKARSCANYLAEELALPPAQEIIDQLPHGDLSTDSGALRKCLRGGTAFHSTDLNRDERAIVERAFRSSDSVRALGATTTVAAGINTPASTVILADHEFVGEDRREYTVAEYRNMAGRAGRLGLQEEGLSILYAATPFERQQLFQQYVMGQVEPLQSSFQRGEVETWLLRLLAQVPRLPADQTITLLASTFGGFLANLRQPNWKVETTARLYDLVQELLKWELIERDGELLQLTPLGRACGQSSIAFRSCLRLIQLLRAITPDSLTDERLEVSCRSSPASW